MDICLGATRRVFVFKNFVVKVPNIQEYRLFLHGILANIQENTFSKIGRSDLAKVKFCSKFGFILIMERANIISNEVDASDFFDMINQKYKDDYMKDFMISDLKSSNWGYVNGQLVKIDYGN